jgi:L-2-hydroxyglutarate oxidase
VKRVLIIGGGIVGLATAYRLLQEHPSIDVIVLEKEQQLGAHQSTHNSGVLHCGLYYKTGSLKARMAVDGIRQMTEFCREFDVPHEICGKLVLATNAAEVERLQALQERGTANGLQGLRWIAREEIHDIEPHAANGENHAALHVPQEGIVDYKCVIEKLSQQIEKLGGQVVRGAKVLRLEQRNGWRAVTTAGDFRGDYLINCAGLFCDRVAKLASENPRERIVPFRGEYFAIKPERQHLVRNLIYPVPDPQFPFLGVHFTRLISGGIEAGPNAVLAFAREGYTKTKINPRDLSDALSFSGLWKFMAKHHKMCHEEVFRSLRKPLFAKALQRLVPEIREDDLAHGGAGVRAQAMTPEGELVQDFAILQRDDALHILNAPSPAATASLAIGKHIVLCMFRSHQTG